MIYLFEILFPNYAQTLQLNEFFIYLLAPTALLVIKTDEQIPEIDTTVWDYRDWHKCVTLHLIRNYYLSPLAHFHEYNIWWCSSRTRFPLAYNFLVCVNRPNLTVRENIIPHVHIFNFSYKALLPFKVTQISIRVLAKHDNSTCTNSMTCFIHL